MYTNERTSHAYNNKKTHLEKNTKKKKNAKTYSRATLRNTTRKGVLTI